MVAHALGHNIEADMVQWRRDIHQHPETAYEEFRTAAKVADLLRSFGVEVHTGIGQTGVVGILKQGQGNGVIGLRADMDALNLHELNGFDHCSINPGKMHACGHDGHTAMLLGAAKYLATNQTFDGTVVFIFQPAEEGEAGAAAMLEDGLLERFPMQAIYGMHNFPGMPAGTFAVRNGAIMASADTFRLTINGQGGHGAFPHLANNPIITGVQIANAWQAIINQSLDPIQSAVINLSEFRGGSAIAVIPESATLTGSVRAFSSHTQDLIEQRMTDVAEGISQANGVSCEFDYCRNYPATINTREESDLAYAAAVKVAGADKVLQDWPPEMGAEDFSFFLQQVPGCYLFIGNGTEGHSSCSLHNPRYDFNDQVLSAGASFWVQLAEDLLPKGEQARFLS